MRLSKIYTKTGDKGGTMLVSGESISKSAQRIEAYGTVDELNAHLGVLVDHWVKEPKLVSHWLKDSLYRVQNELFDLGGELATPSEFLKNSKQKVLSTQDIERLESEIDRCNEQLEPLSNFVLPGGHPSNSFAHVCRTVCRRAEREVHRLRENDSSVRNETQIYLNRLSDWFFVCSRMVSHLMKAEEVLWQQDGKPSRTRD